MEDEKYTVHEISVFNRSVADSVLVEIEGGADFSSLGKGLEGVGLAVEKLYGPFTKKQNSKYFDAASLLDIGEISPAFFSNKGNFIFIQLIERFPEKPIDIEKVFVQVESFLIKKEQESSRVRGARDLRNKYNISINTSLLYKK